MEETFTPTPERPISEEDWGHPNYEWIENDPKTREPIRFCRDGIVYRVSGECNQCGDCCRFYTTHGYTCDKFDKKTNLCTIHPDNPIWCRNFPGVEKFELMSERCSYVITREDTGEVMKYGLQTTLEKSGLKVDSAEEVDNG